MALFEPSVLLLHISQSFGDVGYPRLSEVVADPREAGKHRSDCLGIVYSPTSVPHLFFAGIVEVLQSFADCLSVIESLLTHTLEDVSRCFLRKGQIFLRFYRFWWP